MDDTRPLQLLLDRLETHAARFAVALLLILLTWAIARLAAAMIRVLAQRMKMLKSL